MAGTQSFWKATVQTSAAQLLPYNPRRVGLIIKNYSGNPCFISNDISDPAGQGFPLSVGDYLIMQKVNKDVPELQLYAIASGGATELRIAETFEVEEVVPAA